MNTGVVGNAKDRRIPIFFPIFYSNLFCSEKGVLTTNLLWHKIMELRLSVLRNLSSEKKFNCFDCSVAHLLLNRSFQLLFFCTTHFRGDQNDEDTRTFCGKFLYNAIGSTDNAQHKNCPSSGIDDRPGRDLFRVLKRSPISQPHTLGL